MKRLMLILMGVLMVIPAFAEVKISGETRAGVVSSLDESDNVYLEQRLYFDYTLDDYTSGRVYLRAKTTSTAPAPVWPGTYFYAAYFNTDFAKFLALDGVKLNLKGGLADLVGGAIASLNPFQLNYVEYLQGTNPLVRLDAGLPFLTFYAGIQFPVSDAGNPGLSDNEWYPTLIGAYGDFKAQGLSYEVAWEHPTAAVTGVGYAGEAGNLFIQTVYKKEIAGGIKVGLGLAVDQDLDDETVDGSGPAETAVGDMTTNYGLSTRFEKTGDLGFCLGLDFNGSTYKDATTGDQDYLANAVALTVAFTPKILTIEGGLVYDLNKNSTTEGLALFYAGILKRIGALDLRAGWAGASNTNLDIRNFDTATAHVNITTDNPLWADINKAVNGAAYLNATIKF